MTDAEVAVFTLIEFGPSGDQTETPRPVHGQVVIGEVRAIAEMRIPASRAPTYSTPFPASSITFRDSGSARKTRATGGRRRQHDVEKVVAGACCVRATSFLHFENGESCAVLVGYVVDAQQVRELQGKHAFAAGFGTKTHFRFAFE